MSWHEFVSSLFDLYAKSVPTAQELAAYAQRSINSVVVLFMAFLLVRLAYLVVRFGARGIGRAAERVGRFYPVETVESLLRSICKYAIYIAAVIVVLRIWGVPTGSLIVGSAIIGGAVGFGSQGLIQDIITGLSLLFENQLAVGDWVEIGGRTGVVEEVGLRAVRIRDALGMRHIIFNRTIGSVSNYTARAVAVRVDLITVKRELAEELRTRLSEMAESLGSDRSRYVEPLAVTRTGRTESGEAWIRLEGRVVPFQHQFVRAELEGAIKRLARAMAIELPPENLTITFSAVREEAGCERPAG